MPLSENPSNQGLSLRGDERLKEHVIDFEDLVKTSQSLNPSEIVRAIKDTRAESVYITLGTTKSQAGSAANFSRIDRDYVLAGAKAALDENRTANQRLIYCSGANKSSRLPYLQSKGKTEEGLANLGYSDCILFRPAFLSGAQRDRTKVFERIFGSLMMTNIGGRISNNAEIQVTDVAKAMAVAGINGTTGMSTLGLINSSENFESTEGSKTTFINNLEAKVLAKHV